MALANVIPPMEDFAHTGEGSDFGFEFTGPVEAGGPNVTLFGDAVVCIRFPLAHGLLTRAVA